MLHDEHPPHVEVQPEFACGVKEIQWRLRRNEQQGPVFGSAFRAKRPRLHRLVPVVGDVFVKFFVLLGGDL